MEALSSRILLRPTDLERSHRFYRDTLGLAVYREFGGPEHLGLVFFLGTGFLEVSGQAGPSTHHTLSLWIQVRDVAAEHARLTGEGVRFLQDPRREPWGLIEAWLEDPDGVRIVLVQVPDDHPLKQDSR